MSGVALVTGGSGGIGSAIVRSLAQAGHTVVVGYNSAADAAVSLVEQLEGEGHTALRVSVLDHASLDDAADRIATSFGRLDVLVNCAGITRPVPHDDLDALDDELIDDIFATNWRGPFAAVRTMRPLLDKSDDAVVVNISSIAAVTGQGSNVAYCASKAALDSMTRSLGRALAPSIRVVSVSPGWVLGEYASRMPASVIDAQTDATPMGRLATPDDVGAAVVAAVDHLGFTTGAVLGVDGGRQLGMV